MKITDSIHYVGVLNPNLRVFDIVMKTEYGTSYNAYVVNGSDGAALIDTSHLTFFEYYLDNVKKVVDISKVKYLVMNHNEPDHSGAIAKLLELNPDITILTSQAGSIYLKNITNVPDIKIQVVKDGDTVSLGDKTLRFMIAPFLHWPDSMFTFVEEENVIFTCDFLGSHYCEPQVLDTKVTYPKAFETAFKGYYDAIFGPFKPYVLKGLEKLATVDPDFVCTSHGPVLTKGGLLEYTKEQYLKWSTPVARENKLIPIFYCSAYGNTRLIANAIAQGVKNVYPDADVPVYDVIDHDMDMLSAELNASDAFLLGSPTLNRDAVPPIWSLLCHVDAVNIQKRPVALFGSFGWSGEACQNLAGRLTSLKTNLFPDMFKVTFIPSKQDLENATKFGEEFAKSL